MPASPKKTPTPRASGPGRPKDLGKRAAILAAARQMFTTQGYEGTSMDVVRAHCETQLPPALFEPTAGTPLRERLLAIAGAFYAMVTTPESVAGHRMLCTPQLAGSPLSRLFWEAGPQRVHDDFAALLERRIAAGELEIEDVPRAAGQFFALLKGEPHARRVFGCCDGKAEAADVVQAHLAASVDLFLRAYAPAGRQSQ